MAKSGKTQSGDSGTGAAERAGACRACSRTDRRRCGACRAVSGTDRGRAVSGTDGGSADHGTGIGCADRTGCIRRYGAGTAAHAGE